MLIASQMLGKVNTGGISIGCYGITDSPGCKEYPDGGFGLRSVNTGATLADIAGVIADPYGVQYLGDDGHDNGQVWTNALWQARRAIAALDGGDMLTSARAQVFDKAVHVATSSMLTGSADLADAAQAVQQAAAQVGLTGRERDLIADRFRANGLCAGCASRVTFTPVATSGRLQSRPAVAGSNVVYIDYTSQVSTVAMAKDLSTDQVRKVLPQDDLTVTVSGRGDWVAQTLYNFAKRRESLGLMNLRTGKPSVVATGIDAAVQPGVGSEGLAWVDSKGSVHYRRLDGGKTANLAPKGRVDRVATDNGIVAIQRGDGTVSVWEPATGAVEDIDRVDAAGVSSQTLPNGGLAMWGSRIAVLARAQDTSSEVLIYDLSARTKTTVKANAVGFLGLAMNDDLVVWSEVTGPLPGLINKLDGGTAQDTALTAYRISTDDAVRFADTSGQQGFPALSDRVGAWQETSSGGQDVYAITLKQ